MVVSSSVECIIWLTVFTAEFVAIVTVNLLSILLFIKNRRLGTRSMYLIISLTVADMLVGVLCVGHVQFNLLRQCRLIKLNLSLEVGLLLSSFDFFFPFVSLTNIAAVSLERFHATFRPFRHRLMTGHRLGVRGGNCCCLGFSSNYFSHSRGRVSFFSIFSLHTGILLSFVFNCYLCFLHVRSL